MSINSRMMSHCLLPQFGIDASLLFENLLHFRRDEALAGNPGEIASLHTILPHLPINAPLIAQRRFALGIEFPFPFKL